MKWTKDPRKQWTRELEKFHFQKKGFTSWAWLAAAHFTCFQFHYQARQINSHTCLWLPFNLEPLICPLSQQIAILLAFHENTFRWASRVVTYRIESEFFVWRLNSEREILPISASATGLTSVWTDRVQFVSHSRCFDYRSVERKMSTVDAKMKLRLSSHAMSDFLAWMSRQCNETRR